MPDSTMTSNNQLGEVRSRGRWFDDRRHANGVVPAGFAGAPRTIALQLTESW